MESNSFLETKSAAQAQQTGQAGEAAPRPSALDQAGGTKGVIYSALPALAFVVAHNFLGLTASIVAAFAVAVAIGVARLMGGESLQPAVGGVFGVAIAAGVVWFTGSAKDYFLIGIWASLAGAILFLASVLVRWPLAGVIWNV
ncbi:DUF3159 domain-containing protein, partial [Streptomyces sp. NPDC055239]